MAPEPQSEFSVVVSELVCQHGVNGVHVELEEAAPPKFCLLLETMTHQTSSSGL